MTTISGQIPEALARWTPRGSPSVALAVVDVTVEPLQIAGAAGELGRVLLEYETDDAPGPRSLIAKFRGTSETQQAMDAALGIFARERRFYDEIAPSLELATPACFHAGTGMVAAAAGGSPRPSHGRSGRRAEPSRRRAPRRRARRSARHVLGEADPG